MNLRTFVEQRYADYPSGFGGCRNSNTNYDACDYDVTIFDNKNSEEIIEYENHFIKIHHGTLGETKSELLVLYDGMNVINDAAWDLRMFLSKIKEKRQKLFFDYAKNCLIESQFCSQKALEGIKTSDVFAACWQKCAIYLLADGISALNFTVPSSHMLDAMRQFEKNPINENISIVNETVGIERATPSLLQRMLKSTIGFSDSIEANNHSKIIQQKHDYFIKNSMLSDCYFYLGHVNKDIFLKIRGTIHKNPNLIHILKIAFDIENDPALLEQQASRTRKSSNEILGVL